jgi:hypothetical protein
MTDWHDPKVKLPEDGQECLLMTHSRGLITQAVYGPIAWQGGVWLDLFRTPEAGELIRPADVALWTLWEPIAPREDHDDE